VKGVSWELVLVLKCGDLNILPGIGTTRLRVYFALQATQSMVCALELVHDKIMTKIQRKLLKTYRTT
jgi:hypothetical protein